MNENDCLCFSCRLYDVTAGCTALSDTNFNGKPCPFYKPERNTERFTGSICKMCFASYGGGTKCGVLLKRPRDGCCEFYKTKEQYLAELKKSEKRIKEIEKTHPNKFVKYYALRNPHEKAEQSE